MILESLHHKLHGFLVYDPAELCFRTLDGELLDTKDKHRDYMVRVLRLPRA